MTDDRPSSVILRNKGVPITLAKLDEDGSRMLDADENPVTERVWLRFTGNTVAEVEEKYDSTEGFQKALEQRPFGTIRNVIAMALNRSPEDVGEAMLGDHVDEYQTAVGCAWSIANGMDPTIAAEIQRVGLKSMREGRAEAAAEIKKQLATLGTDGSDSTSESVEVPSLSSGS